MTVTRTWTIGADPDCDIVVDLPTVSGLHCRLVQSPEGFLLEDLQSTNGTYVNGQTVSAPVQVTRTDVILLGSKVALPWPDLTVASLSQPPETRPPDTGADARTIERRHVVGALCGAGIAAALFVYTVVSGGSRKGGPPQADASRSERDSSPGQRDKAEMTADASTGNRDRPASDAGQTADSKRKPAAVPDPETILKEQERNVVWVGYRLRDVTFPFASGWLVRPDRVVTTASAVAELEPLSKDGFETVVWREGRILRVTAFRRHPAFEVENEVSEVSKHANVGLLELEHPLDSHCPIASDEELAALGGARTLLAIGFESRLGENQPFDELKVKRLRHKAELVSSEALAPNSTRLYRLSAPTGNCWEGAPVFNDRGHVVGVLGVISGEARMVPVSQLSRLLKSTAGIR